MQRSRRHKRKTASRNAPIRWRRAGERLQVKRLYYLLRRLVGRITLRSSAPDERTIMSGFTSLVLAYQGMSFSALPGAVFTILARTFPLAASMTVTPSPVLS